MNRARFLTFLLAIVGHAAILCFGGLLLFHSPKHRQAKTEEYEVTVEEQKDKAKEEEKPKDVAEEKQALPEAAPELKDDAPPMDLAQMESALNAGAGDVGGDFGSRVRSLGAAAAGTDKLGNGMDAVFSIAELDQAPRPVFQPPPEYPAELRRQMPNGTVFVLFLVGTDGRVSHAKIQKATDPVFESAALAAVKRWRFEPGRRAGQAVESRMAVPITFQGQG